MVVSSSLVTAVHNRLQNKYKSSDNHLTPCSLCGKEMFHNMTCVPAYVDVTLSDGRSVRIYLCEDCVRLYDTSFDEETETKRR